ncbi:MAG: TolC family protein [Flavobacteriales bacterium]|nr:TolC family protein [Flavobacteriales bacterium]
MQKSNFKLIFIIILFPLLSQAQEQLGVMDAVNIAMKDNYDIKIAKNNLKIAENNAGLMNSGYLPSLNANGGATYKNEDSYMDLGNGVVRDVDNAETESYNYGVTLNYRLFDGMGRYYNYKKFKASYTLSELEGRATVENTLMKLIGSYYEVARLSSKLENLNRTLEISNKRMNLTKTQFDYGQASKLDVLRAEVDKNNDSVNYITTNRELLVSRRDLNVILARDVRTPFEVDTLVLFSQDIVEDKMMEMALDQNVDYLISQQNIGIASLDKKSKRSGFIPKIDLKGGYSGSSTDSDGGFALHSEATGYNANASLNWDVFDGGRTHTQVQNAKIVELNAQEKANSQLRNLEREVSNAYVNYKNSLFIMEVEQNNMKTNKLNFSYSKDQFALGQINSIDFRKAQVDLEDSINRYNQAKYTAKVAEMQLMKLSGLFMQEINVAK